MNPIYQINAKAVKNLESSSDMKRLVFLQVVYFLSYLAQVSTTLLSIAWLALTSGIPPNRITKISLEAGTNEDEWIKLDPDSSTLVYPVVKGATMLDASDPFKKLSKHTVMQLAIPPAVAAQLQELILNNGFRRLKQQLKHHAIKFSRTCGGAPPYLSRLSASFWTLVAPGLTGVEKTNICGKAYSTYRAQSHYYQFWLPDLNNDLQDQIALFIRKILAVPSISIELRSFLEDMSYGTTLPTGWVGSQVARSIDELGQIIKRLSDLFTKEKRKLTYLRQHERLLCLAELFNLQQFQLFLLQQISWAMRPYAKKADIYFCLEWNLAYLRDKDSSSFVEHGICVIPDILREQYVTSEQDRAWLQSQLAAMGIIQKGLDKLLSSPFALYVSLNSTNTRATFKKMTSSRWMHLLDKHRLLDNIPEESNFVRHTMASYMNQRHPEPIVDEYMRHHRDGLDSTMPYSSASWESHAKLKQDLDNLMKQLCIHILTVGDHYEFTRAA